MWFFLFGTCLYRRRACTQGLFLCKAELGFFHFLEIVTGWLVPSVGQKIPEQPGWYLPLVRRSQYNLAGTFHPRRSHLLKTGFFRQVRELKIQRKNPGSALCRKEGDQLLGVHHCLMLYAMSEDHDSPLRRDLEGSDPSNAIRLGYVVWLVDLRHISIN